MPFNFKQANVNKFTVYFSPTCSSLQFLNRDYTLLCGHTHTHTHTTNALPSGLSAHDLRAAQNRSLLLFYPTWNSSRRFHIWEEHERKVKLSRLELKLRILIIVASHIHFHNHDKIATFTAMGYLYHGDEKNFIFSIFRGCFYWNRYRSSKMVFSVFCIFNKFYFA